MIIDHLGYMRTVPQDDPTPGWEKFYASYLPKGQWYEKYRAIYQRIRSTDTQDEKSRQ